MLKYIIILPVALAFTFAASWWNPHRFKVFMRLVIYIPLSVVFVVLLFVLFDIIHHVLGLFLHMCLKCIVWALFYDDHFKWELSDYLAHVKATHLPWRTLAFRYINQMRIFVFGAILWTSVVALFLVQEWKRVTFKEAFKTVLRDQLFLLDLLYWLLGRLLELFAWCVQWLRRFVSDKQMQEAFKRAAQKATTEQSAH